MAGAEVAVLILRVTVIIEGEFRVWSAAGVGGAEGRSGGLQGCLRCRKKKITRRKMFKAVHSCFMLFIPVSAMNRQIK